MAPCLCWSFALRRADWSARVADIRDTLGAPLHAAALAGRGGGPWLSRCFRSRAFRAASAVCWRSMPLRCRRAAARITALIGPNGAGKTTLFCRDLRLSQTERGPGSVWRRGCHRRAAAPARAARHRAHLPDRAAVRRAVGARQYSGRRASAPSRACRGARPSPKQVGCDVGLGDLLDRPAHTLTVAGRKRLELARALGDRAEASSARRSPGRAQPVGNPRHRAGHPRAFGAGHCRADDRACDAGGDEPRRACLRAGRRAASSRRAVRRKWLPIQPSSRPISATARRPRSEARMSTETCPLSRCSRFARCAPAMATPTYCAASI